MSLISVRDLTKTYRLGKTEVHALRGVDLDVEKGDYLCVGGPSGAGKSTLLNIMGLLDDLTDGLLMYNGMQISMLSKKDVLNFRRKNIAFIFQSFNLIPVLTARENIEFPLLIQKIGRLERDRRINRLANEVGIGDFLEHKPDELSGGQRQRVAIARALVTEPAVVFADEPTANLDSVNGSNVLQMMRRLNKENKTTFIIASHDQKIINDADKTIQVVDGRICNE